MSAVPCPLLLLIGGAPASGKTTLAAHLSTALALPFLSKDLIKESLFDTLGAPDRERSRELSRAAYGVLYAVAGRMLDVGASVLLESNFLRGRSEQELGPLVGRSCAVLVHCQTGREEIVRRYDARLVGGRHPGHHDAEAFADVLPSLDAGAYAPLDLPIPRLVVDTTNGYEPAVPAIVAFVRASGG